MLLFGKGRQSCVTLQNKAHMCSVTGSTHQETADGNERGERRLQGMRSIDKTTGNNACVADDKGLCLNVKRVMSRAPQSV